MEHFLPLAIASMVISLISIILLDYFGPNTSNKTESTALSDTENSVEDTSMVTKKVEAETNMEKTAGQPQPIKTAESFDKNIENPSIDSFSWLNTGVIISNNYLQLGR